MHEEYTPLTRILILIVAVILLILISISIAATAGGYFQLFNTEESEESIEEEYTIRENLTPPSNIQMNLGSGSLSAATVTGTTVTGTTVTGGGIILKGGTNGQASVIEIPSGGSIKLGGKQFMVVTPSAWHVKLQSNTNDDQKWYASEINNLINQGEYFVTYAGKTYSPIALHTSPNFYVGDSWRLTEMYGFEGSERNHENQNNAHLDTNKINTANAVIINRHNSVDGSGFWTIELKSNKSNKGAVVIFT
jgi:predicted phage tail protein